ncbi:hypothetical protein K0M31_015380 [Melipona bicolor]|uniref:Uncharacterized protein n=1 Tax=Melipona bicolor TaxID=60889 RepID=A0AA40FFN1_9HYME|nr:hypothetical protein K0M31_015380 [Melipona bicolor]
MGDRIDSTEESSVVNLLYGKCQLPDSQFRPIVREIWEQVAYASPSLEDEDLHKTSQQGQLKVKEKMQRLLLNSTSKLLKIRIHRLGKSDELKTTRARRCTPFTNYRRRNSSTKRGIVFPLRSFGLFAVLLPENLSFAGFLSDIAVKVLVAPFPDDSRTLLNRRVKRRKIAKACSRRKLEKEEKFRKAQKKRQTIRTVEEDESWKVESLKNGELEDRKD